MKCFYKVLSICTIVLEFALDQLWRTFVRKDINKVDLIMMIVYLSYRSITLKRVMQCSKKEIKITPQKSSYLNHIGVLPDWDYLHVWKQGRDILRVCDWLLNVLLFFAALSIKLQSPDSVLRKYYHVLGACTVQKWIT